MIASYLESLRIRVDGRERVVYLRRNSSDTQLVGQVFVDNAFALQRLPRVDELSGWLDGCRSLRKRPLIIDAGANIGLSAISLAAQIPDALTVAVEPEPANFELLVANTDGLPVLPLPAALSGSPGRVCISNPGLGHWGYRTTTPEAAGDGVQVPTTTVDLIIQAMAGIGLPCIVKIDIEGAEADVFAADCPWLDSVPLVIVEIHDWMLRRARSSHPVLRRLLQADRDFVIIGENLFCMPNEALRIPAVTGRQPCEGGDA